MLLSVNFLVYSTEWVSKYHYYGEKNNQKIILEDTQFFLPSHHSSEYRTKIRLLKMRPVGTCVGTYLNALEIFQIFFFSLSLDNIWGGYLIKFSITTQNYCLFARLNFENFLVPTLVNVHICRKERSRKEILAASGYFFQVSFSWHSRVEIILVLSLHHWLFWNAERGRG